MVPWAAGALGFFSFFQVADDLYACGWGKARPVASRVVEWDMTSDLRIGGNGPGIRLTPFFKDVYLFFAHVQYLCEECRCLSRLRCEEMIKRFLECSGRSSVDQKSARPLSHSLYRVSPLD